jgi:hypothetical protein
MTAIAQRRKRRTMIGAAMAVLLVAAASAMFVVGVVTLSNSQEGEAVGIDTRPRVDLPATPNALLALTDENGELASLVVLTLLPEGQGGSIVTVPVNADASAGFGLQRRPLDESFDSADPEGLVASVEDMLSITLERAEIVDPEGLEAMLPEIDALQLVLPVDVVDSEGGGGLISEAGPQTFTSRELTTILAAIDAGAEVDVSHTNDVVVWEALAQTAPIGVPPEPVPLDADGRAIAPDTVGELVDRLWQGEVTVRDLLRRSLDDIENPTAVDVVLIDRRDSTLVFAQVSPALVSTPNTGLKARIVANFTDDELTAADGLYDSSSEVAIELIGRLLFLGGNIVSVETAGSGVPPVTLIEVGDESQLEETIAAAETLLGGAEVSVATTVLEGVDVQITLGMSYLDHEVARASNADLGEVDVTDSVAPTTESPTDTVAPTTEVPGTVATDG